jgi:hypothetical protein
MKVLGWLTHSVKKIITLDFVSGDNFFPRVLIYPNTFIQGQYVYIIIPHILITINRLIWLDNG